VSGSVLRDIIRGVTDLIYPPSCILCSADLSLDDCPFQICLPCQVLFAPNHPPFCRRCSRHLENPSVPYCRACQRRPFHFDLAWAACEYNGVMKHAIHLFKYGQKTALRRHFAGLIMSFLRAYRIDLSGYDRLCPVPLSPTRMRERTFNQAALLARELAPFLGVPLDEKLLQRRRNTKNQAKLSPKDRWTNIRGAFTIRNSSALNGQNILILDDLLTTGATASEAALALKQAGANRVGVLTLSIAEFN